MARLQDFSINGIENERNFIPDLKGKVVLAVNVASKCGLTPQYEGLQKLYEELDEQNFIVVGFPCNQIDVNGPGQHPIYAWLQSEFPGDIEWNFEKFLIDRDGKVINRYPPQTPPDDKGLLQDIADAL